MPTSRLSSVTAPLVMPVELSQLKAQCRIEQSETAWDAELELQRQAAITYVEEAADITLGQRQYALQLTRFPIARLNDIYLPRPPLVSVDEIKYQDTAGAWQVIPDTDYEVLPGGVSVVRPVYGKYWPSTARCQLGAVEITYTAGTNDASLIDPRAKQAVLMLGAHWYLNREAVTMGNPKEIQFATQALIDQVRPGDEFDQPIMDTRGAELYEGHS